MAEGVKKAEPILNSSLKDVFTYGPFASYLDGKRVLLKKVDMNAIPQDVKLLWEVNTSYDGAHLVDELNKALIDAHDGGGFCRFTYKESDGLTPGVALSPSLKYGFFKVTGNIYGTKMVKRVFEHRVPLVVKERWDDEAEMTVVEKVAEWVTALKVASVIEVAYSRWCPLDYDMEDMGWIDIITY